MNARSRYPPKPWRRKVCFGGLRRNMGEEATAVKPWSFTKEFVALKLAS
jgi:hypothetical protein